MDTIGLTQKLWNAMLDPKCTAIFESLGGGGRVISDQFVRDLAKNLFESAEHKAMLSAFQIRGVDESMMEAISNAGVERSHNPYS
jgi:hypothetical protein